MIQETRSSKKSCGPILFPLSWYICDDVNHCSTIVPVPLRQLAGVGSKLFSYYQH